ncbi:MAG: toxin-antitoxin system YwqK family antitoxin [Deltaproteobacteria bacterium]|nr:toxin-antitoxin system YwqK family antitoxin [Deltaproteobacteria bacterium]
MRPIPTAPSLIIALCALLLAPNVFAAPTLTCPPGTSARGKAGQSQYCVKPNGRRHGPAALWQADGKLVAKTIYKNGAKTTYLRYHRNGKMQLRVRYRSGILNGPWESWYTHGTRSARGVYKKGLLEGRFTLYHFSGVPSETGVYRHNVREGLWTFFHKNGKKAVMGHYVNGVRDGAWTDYDEKGSKTRELHYTQGRLKP